MTRRFLLTIMSLLIASVSLAPTPTAIAADAKPPRNVQSLTISMAPSSAMVPLPQRG